MKIIKIRKCHYLLKLNSVLKAILIFTLLITSQILLASDKSGNYPPQENDQPIIFITGGASIYGGEHITTNSGQLIIYNSTEEILSKKQNLWELEIKVETVLIVKAESDDKNNILGISKEFVKVKKLKNRSLQIHQNRLQSEIKSTIITSINKKYYFFWLQFTSEHRIVSSSTSYFNCASVLVDVSYEFREIMFQLSKKQCYAFSQHLRVAKVNASFLRGPPFLFA